MANITILDFDKLIGDWLPIRLKTQKIIAFCAVLLAPLKSLYLTFKVWETKSQYDIKYQTGQVAHLEKVINDKFDEVDKRIYIGPGIKPPRRYLRLRLVDDPWYIPLRVSANPEYIYTRDAYMYGQVDFTVNVPSALNTIDTIYLTAIVNRYKRDSKSFIIQYFS